MVEGGKDKNTHNALDKITGGISEGEEQDLEEEEAKV